MDEDKYLVEQLLADNVGNVMDMKVTSTLEDDGKTWKVHGFCKYSLTMDGKNWGDVSTEVFTYDTNVGNGLATIMYNLMNAMGDPVLLQSLAKNVEKSEQYIGDENEN
jgi:hypothetical protein